MFCDPMGGLIVCLVVSLGAPDAKTGRTTTGAAAAARGSSMALDEAMMILNANKAALEKTDMKVLEEVCDSLPTVKPQHASHSHVDIPLPSNTIASSK